jgi:hypothetical protein
MDTENKPMTAEQMVRELYKNFPEASSGSALQCVGWKYDTFVFKFLDEETGAKHIVKLAQALRGFDKLVKDVQTRGKLKGCFFKADFAISPDSWDGIGIDALAQYAVFGEAIYG